MRISALFQLYTPALIAQRTASYLMDSEHTGRYEVLAQEIAATPEESITLVLTRGKDGLKFAGFDGSEDCFRLMAAAELGNVDTGDIKEKMRDAVEILEGYSFFRV